MSDSITFDATFMLDFALGNPGSSTLGVLEGMSRQEKFALVGEMYFPGIPDDHLTQMVFGLIMAHKAQIPPMQRQTPVQEMPAQVQQPAPLDLDNTEVKTEDAPAEQTEDAPAEQTEEEVITADPVQITTAPIPLPSKINYAASVGVSSADDGWTVVKSRRKPDLDLNYKVMTPEQKVAQCLTKSRPMPESWQPRDTSAFYVLADGLIPQQFDTHLHDMEDTEFEDADGNTVTHRTPIGWYYDGRDDDFAYFKTKETDNHFWELNLKTGTWRVYTLDDEDRPIYHKPQDIIGRMLRNRKMHRLRHVDYIAHYLRSA